jgi:hypothetical protein
LLNRPKKVMKYCAFCAKREEWIHADQVESLIFDCVVDCAVA